MNTQECFVVYKDCGSKIHDYLLSIPDVSDRVVLAWEKGGLLTPTWKNGALIRLWMNVIAHQTATALLAHKLVSYSPVILDREEFTVKEVVEAALVHDSFKRREWEINEKAKQLGKDWATANRKAELSSNKFLNKLGFSDNVVLLASNTGDIGLEQMMQPNPTIGQQILFYSDCCVSGDKIVSFKKRFDDLLVYFQPGGRYEAVDAAYLQKYGKTHRQVWDSVVIPIQERLAQLTKFSGSPENLYKLAST